VNRALRFSRGRPLLFLTSLFSLTLLVPAGGAEAAPQASLGLDVGGAAEETDEGPTRGAFDLGGRADVLLGRTRGTDMAIGPYLEAATLSFHNLDVAAGAEWLIPVRDDLPLVLSGGALLRDQGGRPLSPGVEGTVFFGSRSYNFHSWYGLAAGLFAQTRFVPGPPSTIDFVFGIQIDAELLIMPGLLLWGLFK